MTAILRTWGLTLALTGYVPPGGAGAHVVAAARAASADLPTEVLLAVAWVESRFDPTATSRVQSGRRVVGRWPSRSPAGRGPRFCGVGQAMAGDSWRACLALRPLEAGYAAGAAELRYWLRRSHGDLAAALRGHGCGNRGLTRSCNGYDRRVIAFARRLGWRP